MFFCYEMILFILYSAVAVKNIHSEAPHYACIAYTGTAEFNYHQIMLTVLVEQRRWLQRYNPDAVF
jgi:hypothetical protein